MSFKAKDLSYEANTPTFLRRLRGEISSSGVDPDRHERPIARPRRPKQADEDDGPTYVLEDSNETISKEEFEALAAGKQGLEGGAGPLKELSETPKVDEAANLENAVDGGAKEESRAKQVVAEVGKGVRKRKAVKVVGDVEGEDDEPDPKIKKKKPKKRAKPIKLSFGDDEG